VSRPIAWPPSTERSGGQGLDGDSPEFFDTTLGYVIKYAGWRRRGAVSLIEFRDGVRSGQAGTRC